MAGDPTLATVAERPSLFNNSLWNALSFGLGLPLVLVATPIFLSRLGLAQYGIYVLLATITSSLSVLSAGISPATVKYIAEFESRGRIRECENLVATGLSFSLVLGGAGMLVSWVASEWLATVLFKVAPQLQAEAILTFRLGGVLWFVSQIGVTFQSAIEGLQDYRRICIGTFLQQTLNTAGGVLLVLVYPRVSGLLVLNVVVGTGFCMYWYIYARGRLPGLSFLPGGDRVSFKATLNFSAWQSLNGVCGIAAGNADRFLVASFFSVGAVGIYGVARKGMEVTRQLVFPIYRTFFPASSALSQTNGGSERLILDQGWAVSALAAWLYAVVFVLGPDLLRIWVGGQVGGVAGPVLRVFMATALLELPSNLMGQYVLGRGLVREGALVNVATSGLTLTAMYFLTKRFGMIGAAWSGFLGLAATRPPFHAWVFGRFFGPARSPWGCFSDTYGVLLSAGLGALAALGARAAVALACGPPVGPLLSALLVPVVIAAVMFGAETSAGHGDKLAMLGSRLRSKGLDLVAASRRLIRA